MTKQTRVPGPRGAAMARTAWRMSSDGATLLKELTALARHGPVAGFSVGPVQVVLVTGPEEIRHVLLENARNYIKGHKLDELRPVIGNGLLSSEGDFWLKQRRLLQPAFHRSRMQGLAALMCEATDEALRSWEERADGAPFEVTEAMATLTLDIVGRALLGTRLRGEAPRVIEALLETMRRSSGRARALLKLPRWVPTPGQRRFQGAVRTLHEVVGEVIRARRDAPPGDDLLWTLLETRDEDGRGMSDAQLRDETMTLLLAGHETTANALAWTFSLLCDAKDVDARVAQEAQATLGDRPARAEDLPKLTYARQVLQESMRLYPPAWLLHRAPLEPDVLGGFRVPRRALMLLSPYVLHHSPEHWPDPERFDPSRFEPQAMSARPRFSYLPFGGGPRACIGNEFALMEAQVILASVARRYRLERVPGHPVELEPAVTLRAKHGIQVVATRRGPAALLAPAGRAIRADACAAG